MHTLDIILLVIASILVVIGIKRGFIGEIIRLLAMIGGFIVAFLYYPDLAAHLKILKLPLHIINTVAFVIVYIGIALLIIGAGWMLKKLIHLTLLGWVDRLLGGVIGLSKALLLAWAACLSISSFPVHNVQRDFTKSIVYGTFKKLPAGFSLRGVTTTREKIKTIYTKTAPEKIEKTQKKLKNFKTTVDSAKHSETL